VEIVYLKELKELKLSRNYIQHLPPSISDMKLQLLAVNNNRLCELPMDIGKMKTLKSLDVSRNDLTELPPSIVDLSQLNYLDIFRNEIRELPEGPFIHSIMFCGIVSLVCDNIVGTYCNIVLS
jgi:Leucine-rich repeat (LRR) protein